MLLPEARLEALVGQLDTLPAGDRRAILARLSPEERALVRGTAVRPAVPASPYSPDIAAVVTAGDKAPITPVARKALADALAAAKPARDAEPAGSLADAFSGLLRRLSPK